MITHSGNKSGGRNWIVDNWNTDSGICVDKTAHQWRVMKLLDRPNWKDLCANNLPVTKKTNIRDLSKTSRRAQSTGYDRYLDKGKLKPVVQSQLNLDLESSRGVTAMSNAHSGEDTESICIRCDGVVASSAVRILAAKLRHCTCDRQSHNLKSYA